LYFLSASVRDTVDDAAGLALINHTIMAAAAVDVGYLAASYSVPETTIQSLLSEPTVELVQSLLAQIESKAREFEDLQSEKLKADVELDNAVQSGEQRARTLKAAADQAQKETAELRQKVAQEGT
jgi:nucleoprotein TPR